MTEFYKVTRSHVHEEATVIKNTHDNPLIQYHDECFEVGDIFHDNHNDNTATEFKELSN